MANDYFGLKWLIWAFFGNDDDGIYGKYEHTWWGAVKWWFRNPMHNFMVYVIGLKGKPFVRKTWPAGHDDDQFVSEVTGGWLFAITYYKWMRLPFVSYQGKIRGYIGWGSGGYFGLELRYNSNFGKAQAN